MIPCLVRWVILIATLTSGTLCKQCSIPEDQRFDCNPEVSASQKVCESRGCCWIPSKGPRIEGAPRCFYPLNYEGYQTEGVKETKYGLTANITRVSSGYYPNIVKTLKMDLYFETSRRLHFKVNMLIIYKESEFCQIFEIVIE